ncbi:hypothetical protein [Luedemannella flava]|uniref:hypothetical protein n=1 Tax=Luedemannella flava TaxID=349316 RepID=UPI0031D83470
MPTTAWFAAGAAVLAADALSGIEATTYAAAAIAVLSIALGVTIFLRHGGEQITVAGIYSLAFAVFGGFAGIYLVLNPSAQVTPGYLLAAGSIAYAGQVLMWAIFWTGSGGAVARRAVFADRPSVSTVIVGVALIAGAVFVFGGIPGLGIVSAACGFVGVVLVAVGTQCAGPGRRMLWCVPSIAAFAVYYTHLFGGWGRIVVVSLAIAVVMVLCHRPVGRFVKPAMLVSVGPGLVALSQIHGSGFGSELSRERGIGSVVSPLESFAVLLAQHFDGLLPVAFGRTFLAAAVALVPRAFWPDKPVGFGAELVPYISPDLTGTAQSDAALFQGEWLFNFGLPGLLLMVPVTGVLVRWLDDLLARATARPLGTLQANLLYAAVLIAGTGVIDLVWVGTFSYAARAGARLAVLAAVLAVARLLRARSGETLEPGAGPGWPPTPTGGLVDAGRSG